MHLLGGFSTVQVPSPVKRAVEQLHSGEGAKHTFPGAFVELHMNMLHTCTAYHVTVFKLCLQDGRAHCMRVNRWRPSEGATLKRPSSALWEVQRYVSTFDWEAHVRDCLAPLPASSVC